MAIGKSKTAVSVGQQHMPGVHRVYREGPPSFAVRLNARARSSKRAAGGVLVESRRALHTDIDAESSVVEPLTDTSEEQTNSSTSDGVDSVC